MIERVVAREIDYLWSRLARAARGLEGLAPLWSRGSDPRVVRVVESAAYVFARVKEKLEDDIPEISHALIGRALPEALAPTPSATIVRLGDDRRERRDVVVHGVLQVESRAIDGEPCRFQTRWPVATAPVAVARTILRTPEPGLHTLTLHLESYGNASLARVLPDPLRVFVDARNPFRALDLVHAVCLSKDPILARVLGAHGDVLRSVELPSRSARWTALDASDPLFPGPTDRFASGTALRVFHAFPEAFALFDLRGLRAAVAEAPHARAIEITVRLSNLIAEDPGIQCVLDCTPAVNVFPAVAVPFAVRGLGPLGPLRAKGHPAAEILEIRRPRLHTASDRTGAIDVRLWESEGARALWDDELYLRVERRASIDYGPTELLVTLLRPDGGGAVPTPPASCKRTSSQRMDRARTLSCAETSDAGATPCRLRTSRVCRPRSLRGWTRASRGERTPTRECPSCSLLPPLRSRRTSSSMIRGEIARPKEARTRRRPASRRSCERAPIGWSVTR